MVEFAWPSWRETYSASAWLPIQSAAAVWRSECQWSLGRPSSFSFARFAAASSEA
jgi:hypothetical protein